MERRIQVLLADASEEFCLLVSAILHHSGSFTVVGHANSVADALKLARELRPALLLTDAAFPDGSAFSLLRQAAPYVGATVICTAQNVNDVLLRAGSEGVRFVLTRPFTEAQLLAALDQAARLPRIVDDFRFSAAITGVLREAGVPLHVKGYECLHKAVFLALHRPELLHRLTKELYPTIAAQQNTSAFCVERNMRGAVTMAWLAQGGGVPCGPLSELLCLDRSPGLGSFLAAAVSAVRRKLSEHAA